MVHLVSDYVHATEGRLRIKVAEIKRDAQAARRLEAQLRVMPHVHHVEANPLTGNVLILHDPEHWDAFHLVVELRRLGVLRQPAPSARPKTVVHRKPHPAVEKLALSAGGAVLKFALKSLVSAVL